MVTSEKHQKSLLGGIERLVGVQHPDLIPSVPKILMAFYQADIIEEEVVKQWGTHVSKKYVDKETSKKVRKAADPFLKVCSICILLFIYFCSRNSSGLMKPTMRMKMRRNLMKSRLLGCV